jgi:hypothetical protein
MIIGADLYDKICLHINQQLERGQDVCFDDCDVFSIDRPTLLSIFSQAYVRRLKKLTPLVDSKLPEISDVRLYVHSALRLNLLFALIDGRSWSKHLRYCS